jgi:2-oxoglutarate/2-oxoacid ferredoxin oxidoreductase subunit beta
MTEVNVKQFDSKDEIAWCPGCGDFGILAALKQALAELGLKPHEVLVASGIGQAGKTPYYINTNAYNGLHGRGIPAASAAKMANKNLVVAHCSGDGDSYGEGTNHLIHNIRRNIDITHFVHDNQVYGLTKGQGSPTTAQGQVTTLQNDGVRSDSLNPMAMAISLGCSFVARSFSGDKEHLVSIMKQALTHKGYALVDIFQPCVSFNPVNTFKWYKDRVYKLDENYDPTDKLAAFEKAQEWGDKIPVGVIYKEEKPTFLERVPHLKDEPALVDRQWEPKDAEKFLDDFR